MVSVLSESVDSLCRDGADTPILPYIEEKPSHAQILRI